MDQLKAPPALTMADGVHIPPGELVASFPDRKELNKAVEFLAGQQFPVHTLFVVGHDVKQVDYITGQATYPRAALTGAMQGIMLGVMVGIFNSLLTQTSMLANVVSIVPLAIAFCVIWSIFVASRTKGKGIRTRTQMLPSRLDLMAIPATAATARQLLRLPMQGQPGAQPSPGQQTGQHSAGSFPSDTRPSGQENAASGPAYPQWQQRGPQAPAQERHPGAAQQPSPQGSRPVAPASAGSVAAHSTEAEAPAVPAFTPPAETNRDGTRAAGKFGLRVETEEEFEQQIRQQPAPPTTNERVEQVRAEQSEQRYGLRVDDPAEVEKAIRRLPEAEEKDGGQ